MSELNTTNALELSRNYHDVRGIDKLRRAAQQGDEGALREAAQQFEAIFVQMMLKSMRKAQDALESKDSPFNSQQVKFYRDMHDQQLATDLSASGSIGLADLIVRQLGQQQEGFTPASVLRNNGNLDGSREASRQTQSLPVQPPRPLAEKQAAFSDAKGFIEALLPIAEQVTQGMPVDAKALLAQAALETGWGQKMIHSEKGNSHNLFGIKANRSWQGDKARVSTLEYDGQVAKKQLAEFRAYDSFEQSLQDYLHFVQDNPRYAEALKQQDAAGYFQALQQAGYATDPNYADKIMQIYQSPLLRDSAQVTSEQAGVR